MAAATPTETPAPEGSGLGMDARLDQETAQWLRWDQVLPTSKSSQMITFTFANGGVATMRTSGTEPKIKYYAELCAPPGNSDPEHLKKELDELVGAIEEHFFQPQKYNLQPKAE